MIRGKISPESVIYTDRWRGYNGLLDIGYNKHFRIDKSKKFSNQYGVHINGIKSTFELHLKECEWRWRKSTNEMERELWKLIKKY